MAGLLVGTTALVALASCWTALHTEGTSTAGTTPTAVAQPAAERVSHDPPAAPPRSSASNAAVPGTSSPRATTLLHGDRVAVANLDPDLLDALSRAAARAQHDGVSFHVNSGWRSTSEQEELFRQAVAKYGSKEEAARWVAPPEASAHVSGDAVDIGPTKAASWLSSHGTAYGLCQIYRNEPWHYELRPEAIGDGCPQMYADAAQDPRFQQ